MGLMFFRLKSFFSFFPPLVLGVCMHMANTRILKKKMVFQLKKKGEGEQKKKKEKQVFCFWFFFSAIALVRTHIPGKSHTFVLNQKRLPTCATTSTAASGCVQSFNHFTFPVGKKKNKNKKNTNTIEF